MLKQYETLISHFHYVDKTIHVHDALPQPH